MSDEQLIEDFLLRAAESRTTVTPPAAAEASVVQLIGIVGRNSPLRPQALTALTQCDWPLALNFLSALTPAGMVFVPAGAFSMGSDESAEEKPPHSVWLNSFYLDRTPVTNAQFAPFWEDVDYKVSSDAWDGFEAARNSIYKQDLRRAPYYWFDTDWNRPDHPLVGVNWYEAVVFARWAGKRLPTEAEWEKAARGTDGRRFPWGNEFDARLCNTVLADEPPTTTSKPGKFSPQGDSPYGAQDMSGNVWEWTSSADQPYPYLAGAGSQAPRNVPAPLGGGTAMPAAGSREPAGDVREDLVIQARRVLRGGGHGSRFEDHYRCAYRYAQDVKYQYFSVGFRCAATIPPNMRL
jgi:formylglycine-generating enzyme required for sulfatase activity